MNLPPQLSRFNVKEFLKIMNRVVSSEKPGGRGERSRCR